MRNINGRAKALCVPSLYKTHSIFKVHSKGACYTLENAVFLNEISIETRVHIG